MRTFPALSAAVLGCLLTLPAAAFGANGEGTPLGLRPEGAARAAADSAPGAGGGGLVRTIVGLAVVLGVIYGLHWVLKQVKAAKEERHAGTGLDTLATLPLGPNRSLHLIRAGSELVLVGTGEHGVTPIRTYSEDEARALGLLDAGADADADADAVSGAAAVPGALSAPARTPVLAGLVQTLRARTVIR